MFLMFYRRYSTATTIAAASTIFLTTTQQLLSICCVSNILNYVSFCLFLLERDRMIYILQIKKLRQRGACPRSYNLCGRVEFLTQVCLTLKPLFLLLHLLLYLSVYLYLGFLTHAGKKVTPQMLNKSHTSQSTFCMFAKHTTFNTKANNDIVTLKIREIKVKSLCTKSL